MKENNLNNNQINKLNLPNIWTKKKTASLLLMGWLSANGVEAGQNFNKCLGDNLYQGIINLNNSHSDIISIYAFTFNCLSSSCAGFPTSSEEADITFQCAKVGQSTFCVTAGSSDTGAFGGLCGGILGDIQAIDVPGTYCPSLNIVTNALKIGPTTNSTFTWLCCDNPAIRCQVARNVTVNNGWATTNCGHPNLSLMCFADNGGWTCTGGVTMPTVINKEIVSSIYLGIGQVIPGVNASSCTMQLGGIGLSNNVLPVSSNSVPSSPTNSGNIPNGSSSESNSNKIAVATAAPLGTLLLVTTATTFYYRRQLKKALEQQDNREIHLPADDQQYQAQVQVNPYPMQ